jgi:hypothetical protein
MPVTPRYDPNDLALVVRPRQSAPAVYAGRRTWEDAATGAWAMAQDKADRVRVLIAVHEEKVVGAWAVTDRSHDVAVPDGKSRNVSRSSFSTSADSRIAKLLDTPSQWPSQRNPVSTHELRDVQGLEELLGHAEPKITHGVVELGDYRLIVQADGHAQLLVPTGCAVTVRAA